MATGMDLLFEENMKRIGWWMFGAVVIVTSMWSNIFLLTAPVYAATRNFQNAPSAQNAPKIAVPILTYHHIREYKNPQDPLGERLSVTPKTLRAQLQWLNAHNYQTITLDELDAAFFGTRRFTKKPIVLSFDDGYDNAYRAAMTALLPARATGVFFIASGLLGRPGYMNETQVWALDRQGMAIAAHTVDHADLTVISPEKQQYELLESKQVLAKIVGHPVVDLAYPYGHYNDAVEQMAQRLGYRLAATTAKGFVTERTNRLELPRVHMSEGMRLDSFLP